MPFHIGREERDRWLGPHDGGRRGDHRRAAGRRAPTAGAGRPARLLQRRPPSSCATTPACPSRPRRTAGRFGPTCRRSRTRDLTKHYGAVQGRRRPVVRGRRGRGVRPARPQRGRQVDHGRDPRGPPPPDRRRRHGARSRPGHGRRELPRPHRHRAADVRRRARADGGRGRRDLRLVLPPAPRRSRRSSSLVGLAPQLDQRVGAALRRAAAAARPGHGHRRVPGPAVPRRADDRVRPGAPAAAPGSSSASSRRAARRCC